MAGNDAGRLRSVIDRIDAANASDTAVLEYDGERLPKEPTHARLMSEWIERLKPDASDALRIAARAHHIRRWERPRDAYPPGRNGYLRWRDDARDFHVAKTVALAREAGYGEDTVERVARIMGKRRIKLDDEAQAYEDALCLVFIETQLHDLAARTAEATLLNAIRRTWQKMSPAAREVALGFDLRPEDRALIEKAIAARV